MEVLRLAKVERGSIRSLVSLDVLIDAFEVGPEYEEFVRSGIGLIEFILESHPQFIRGMRDDLFTLVGFRKDTMSDFAPLAKRINDAFEGMPYWALYVDLVRAFCVNFFDSLPESLSQSGGLAANKLTAISPP